MPLNAPITDWQDCPVWLIGASSGIGRATASALHAKGAHVVVSARSEDALNAFVAEHPGAKALPLDIGDAQAIQVAAQSLVHQGKLHSVVYCAGHYNAMNATHIDLHDMLRHNQINYVGALHVLDAIVPHLLAQPVNERTGLRGHISLMASVAGYRGLPKSLAYGPTKAALINLTETLYLDLQPHQIGVSLINPGFVKTPLTQHNEFKMPALISPQQAAQEILKGWSGGEFEIHFPKRFTRWMKVLQLLPYSAFFAVTKRLQKT